MDSFEELEYGDEIEYVGPETLDDTHAVAPSDWKQPYTFQWVSMHGGLGCLTKFNGKKRLAADHPANDPSHWEVVEA